MARPKSNRRFASTARKSVAKKSAARGKTKTAQSKGLKQSNALQFPIIRRPDPNMPPNPALIIEITTDLLNIIEALENFAANLRALDRCRKAKGFSAWSLRYAQTPRTNSWSFAKGKPLQKSIISCQMKKTIKTSISPLAKLLSYQA